jgi:outer membrane protein assembly factor BamB
MNAKVMMAAGFLPAALSVTVIWNTFARSAARRRGALAGVLVAGLAAGLFVWRMTLVEVDSIPETNRLEPIVGSGWLFFPVLWIALVTAAWRLTVLSTVTRAALVLLSASTGILALYVVLEQVAIRIPYLAYQLGTPRIEPWPDTRLLVAMGVALIVDALLAARRVKSEAPGAEPLAVRVLFRLAVVAMALVYFFLINFVHVRQEMVRAIVAMDRSSGRIEWVAEGLQAPQESLDGRNSPATPTPVTDGEHVCAYFGNHGVMCVDTSGSLRWSRTDVRYDGYYGVGVSPVLSDGLLVVASDMPDGLARISAFDARTGRPVWVREYSGPGSTSGNSRTPLVRRVDGVTALILWGIDGVRALKIETGEDLWSIPIGGEVDLVASMTSDADKLYLSDRTGTVALDVSRIARGQDPIVWRAQARSNCVSPVRCRHLLVTMSGQRLDGNYFASLIASPDAVYFTNDEGVTTVAACEDQYREIARNDLAEPTIASMAPARDRLYIRTASHLFSLRSGE